MKLPRFTSGSVGRLDYRALNQAFTSIEKLDGAAGANPNPFGVPIRESFVATITGLMTDATQGANQTTGQGTLWKTYVYNWNEVDISYGSDGSESGVGVSDLKGARGIDYTDGVTLTAPKSYYPAIDFAPYRRFNLNDVVLLTRIAVKSGSTYSMMYAVEPLSAVTPFLARLTSVVGGSLSGRYAWTGLSRIIEGTSALNTVATNLYEKNRICQPGGATAQTVNSASWDGTNTWGHGQDASSVTKLDLPVGAEGAGTIVVMHQGHIIESAGGTSFWFYCISPVTCGA